jgi:alkylation response protein AidB-like acyl-CoA dehydrogenase
MRDGDDYVINGSKIFITNGYLAGLIALVVKTQPGTGAKGTSIIMVETANLEGFRVGRILDKMGMKSQDTAELFFENVRVPAANLLGSVEGQGFYQLMGDLPYERALIAVAAVGAMEGALAATIQYVKERSAFGKRIAEFQNTKFKLAEIATKTHVARAHSGRRVAATRREPSTSQIFAHLSLQLRQEWLNNRPSRGRSIRCTRLSKLHYPACGAPAPGCARRLWARSCCCSGPAAARPW